MTCWCSMLACSYVRIKAEKISSLKICRRDSQGNKYFWLKSITSQIGCFPAKSIMWQKRTNWLLWNSTKKVGWFPAKSLYTNGSLLQACRKTSLNQKYHEKCQAPKMAGSPLKTCRQRSFDLKKIAPSFTQWMLSPRRLEALDLDFASPWEALMLGNYGCSIWGFL